jgi:hypothetical protein
MPVGERVRRGAAIRCERLILLKIRLESASHFRLIAAKKSKSVPIRARQSRVFVLFNP